MNLLLLLLPLVTGSSALPGTVVTDCGSQAHVDRVDIEDCYIPPCPVFRPSMQDVNITFTPDREVESFQAVIDAYFGNEHYPWPGPGGCEKLVNGDTCPLVAGHTYKYHAVMPVLEIYPELEVLVTWMLEDNLGQLQVCIAFPVIIS